LRPGSGVNAVRAEVRRLPARRPGGRHRRPRLRRSSPRGTRENRQPALARQARPGIPAARRRPTDRPVPGQAGPDDRQRRAVGDRRRPGLHQPLGSRALARAPAPAPPRTDRSPRRGAGDRQTRPGPPGQAPRDREPRRPGDIRCGTASPGADPETPAGTDRTEETRRPTGHPAATAR
jgi:hypothetical protein